MVKVSSLRKYTNLISAIQVLRFYIIPSCRGIFGLPFKRIEGHFWIRELNFFELLLLANLALHLKRRSSCRLIAKSSMIRKSRRNIYSDLIKAGDNGLCSYFDSAKLGWMVFW
jgi:hypothetical protein